MPLLQTSREWSLWHCDPFTISLQSSTGDGHWAFLWAQLVHLGHPETFSISSPLCFEDISLNFLQVINLSDGHTWLVHLILKVWSWLHNGHLPALCLASSYFCFLLSSLSTLSSLAEPLSSSTMAAASPAAPPFLISLEWRLASRSFSWTDLS